MKYYILSPNTNNFSEYLANNGYEYMSSDLSVNPEGYLVSEKDIKNKFDGYNNFELHEIPTQYCNNIEDFVTDYWDGNIILK